MAQAANLIGLMISGLYAVFKTLCFIRGASYQIVDSFDWLQYDHVQYA